MVADAVCRDIGLRSLRRWSATERRALKNLAPIVAAAAPSDWPAEARRTLRELVRAKGGPSEARFARLLYRHDKFLISLKKKSCASGVCSRARCF